MKKRTRKETILVTIGDVVINLVYYDRKEDEDLSVNDFDSAVEEGEITVLEMVEAFQKRLEDELGVHKGDKGHG
ncbi:hypothetical protein DRQ25_05170 [Candidatus Fermentibacteria bacterium]|nr:MAG: hypothetical protein DRQ25_05170 [Candidatus Fermentibacteria bacterium]